MNGRRAIGWYGPTDGCWAWVQTHFQDVILLRDQDVASFIAHDGPAMRTLIVAIDSRSDPRLRSLIDDQQKDAPESTGAGCNPGPIAIRQALGRDDSECRVCFVLGESWDGHRRTQPLPDGWQTYYWYQLYDMILPSMSGTDIGGQGSLSLVRPATTIAGQTSRKPNPRILRQLQAALDGHQQLSEELHASDHRPLALVVTDQVSEREVWSEGLARYGISVIAANAEQINVWADPSLIVVDMAEPPLALDRDGERKRELVGRLSHQFPGGMLAVVDAFPRFERWQALKLQGADAIISKPYSLTGLLQTWLIWLRSSEQSG